MSSNDTYQVKVTGHYYGQLCENVFWYTQSVGTTNPDIMNDFAELVESTWCQGLAPFQASNFSWDGVVVQKYNPIPNESGVAASTAVGTATGDNTPPWFVYNISWGRRGAGYNYPQKRVSGVAENCIVNAAVSASVRSDILAIANAMTSLTVSGCTWLMRTFTPYPELGQQPYTIPGIRFQEVTTARDVKLGTQKTRK